MPVLHTSKTENRASPYGPAFRFLWKLFVAHVVVRFSHARSSAVDKGKVRTTVDSGAEICI